MKNNLIILALFWCGTATAQNVDSLAHYLDVAARNNPSLGAVFLAYKASLEKIPQAGAFADPELEMGFFLKPMDILDGRQVADFRLMQMFPWFGTRRAARNEATGMSRMAYEKFRQSRDVLFLEVKTGWWTLADLQQQLTNVRENVALLRALKELSTGRAATPQSGMSDVLRIEMELNELDYREQALASRIVSARAKFNALLGRAADSPLAVPDSITMLAPPAGAGFDNNPMLGMAAAEAAAADAAIVMNRRMGLPMFGVGVQYSVIAKRMAMGIPTTEMNGRDMVMPMVSLSIPIWRGKYKAAVNESRLASQAAGEKYRDAQNRLGAEWISRREELAEAERRIELYERQQELALAAYRLAVSEFSTGKTTLSAALEIERQLLDYKTKRSEAVAAYNTVVATIENLISQEQQ